MTELKMDSFKAMSKQDTPLVVDFWAGWCMPCKIFAPVVEELSDELDGRVNFGKVDVDDQRELAAEYNIVSIPTLVIFKNGEEQERMVGVRQKDEVRATIAKYIMT